jgi:cbb3-type cytochrome oxidase maturation protein
MIVIFFLIPLSIVIAACFLGAFIWAVRSGQYEDTCTPAMRLLLEESGSERALRSSNRALVIGSEASEIPTCADAKTCSEVFREGAEHEARGACAPQRISNLITSRSS